MKKILVVLFLLVSCTPNKIIEKDKMVKLADTPIISLQISSQHQEIFNIKDFSYSEQSAKQVFTQIETQTDMACARKQIIKGHNWVMSALINGCLNFYLMNDLDAYKAFSTIREISANKKDCYTVGLAQLYLMNEFAECSNINAIDVDWRIIYTHYQMIQNLKNNKNMFNVKLYDKEKNYGLKTFCEDNDFLECKFAFDGFQHGYKKINNINYQLSHLHDARIKRTENDIVVYVSNAIDPEYTTQEQMDQLLDNIYKALAKNYQKAYIIYHTGGAKQFAIYRLFKVEQTRFKDTVYRDELVWAPSYGNMRGKKYKTYLD